MTRREQLQEQYEDALFALLMDEVAESEGMKALAENERLKQDTESEVPTEVVRRCRKTIDREFAKQSVRSVGRLSWKVIHKVAIVALLGIFLFSAAFAVSEDFRVGTLNLVIDLCGEYADFSFQGSSPAKMGQEATNTAFEVGWLPAGFELKEQHSGQSSDWVEYEGPNGEIINIDLSFLGPSGISGVDTEDAEVKNVIINGYEATLIVKDYIQAVIPISGQLQILYILAVGNTLNEADVIRIAESITIP